MTLKRIGTPSGVEIGIEIAGHGPRLILLHGTTADRARWTPIREALARHFELWLVDRRGRGASSDADPYAFSDEVDDIVAVATAAGGNARILAHSYGALLTLAALPKLTALAGAVLYEPPVPVRKGIMDHATADAIEAALAEHGPQAALLTFYRKVLRMPEEAIAAQIGTENFERRLGLAHTIARELRAATDFEFEARDYADSQVPLLLVLGSESPALFSDAVAMLERNLPLSGTALLPGQRHQAIDAAPQLLLDTVLPFLKRGL